MGLSMKDLNKAKIKNCIIVGCLLLVMLIIWIFPIKSRNISLQMLTDGSYKKDSVQISIYSEKVYRDLYVNSYPVTDNSVIFNIPSEYNPVEKVYVEDKDFAESVKELKVLSNGINIADYVSASFEGNIWEISGDKYIFSQDAMRNIEKGRSNPWMLRIIISFLEIIIVVTYFAYRFIKKRFGKFKSILVFGIFYSVPLVILIFNAYKKSISFFGNSINNITIIIAILVCVAALLIACVLCDKENKISKYIIIAIYIFAVIFSVGKMMFYSERVSNFPDENAHIGYVAYLEKTNEFIPDFEKMPTAGNVNVDTEIRTMVFAPNTINNLRHPPLYYHLMRLSNAITFEDDNTFTVNLDKIRYFSMAIGIIAFVLMFYIGYTRFKKYPIIHLLFSTIIISVPMMCYGLAGVNNDTLALLTTTIAMLGLIRYSEKKCNFGTYFLIALGVSATVLIKMTAGIVVFIAAIGVLAVSMIKEKSWSGLVCWKFLATCPIYLAAFLFYMLMLVRYGSFQPSLHTLSEEFAWSTGFYLPAEQRIMQSLLKYILYFTKSFFTTWEGIFSHITLAKNNFWDGFSFFLMWIFPIVVSLRSNKRLNYRCPIASMYVGLMVSFIMQLVNGYIGLLTRGYLGGYQSRYYLCAILIFALAGALLLEKQLDMKTADADLRQKVVTSASVVYIGLLTYGDFVYFLLHYTNYLL